MAIVSVRIIKARSQHKSYRKWRQLDSSGRGSQIGSCGWRRWPSFPHGGAQAPLLRSHALSDLARGRARSAPLVAIARLVAPFSDAAHGGGPGGAASPCAACRKELLFIAQMAACVRLCTRILRRIVLT